MSRTYFCLNAAPNNMDCRAVDLHVRSRRQPGTFDRKQSLQVLGYILERKDKSEDDTQDIRFHSAFGCSLCDSKSDVRQEMNQSRS